MKKFLATLLALAMVLSLVACGKDTTSTSTSASVSASTSVETSTSTETSASTETSTSVEPEVKAEGVMTYAEYAAAETNAEITIECYVQATQSWWNDAITVYAADADGAYFIYNMACSQEDSAKLVPGTKIRVKGFKAEWAGEVEVDAGATFEIVEGDSFIAPAKDLTDVLGTGDLVKYQNQLASFKGMVIESVSYKNDTPGDDIYVTASKDGISYDFCLEYYLNGSDAAFYDSFATLTPGTVVDIDGYLYWYYGMNPHITAVKVLGNVNDKASAISYAEFAAAAVNTPVVVRFYVQDTQSWWNDSISVYGADIDGGYFAYNLACSQEDAAKLVPGTLIEVTGYKTEWAGEVEIDAGATFTFVDTPFTYIAPATDVTAYVGKEELVNCINQLVAFKDMTVVAVSYKNDTPGDDIYVTLSKDGVNVEFCLEYYLNGSDEAFYNTVGNLAVGSVVDVEGYLYWYNGADAHLTKVVTK